MKVLEVLEKTTQFFKEKNLDSPRLDAELLILDALNLKDRVELYLKFDQPLKESEVVLCRDRVRRRAQGEPVAYILGKRAFYKSEFIVSPGVLVPRPETEIIVEKLLEKLDSEASYKILDMGCGSGCLGLSLVKELPNARLVSVDISPIAAEVTQKNSDKLRLSDRVTVVQGPIEKTEFSDLFDLVVANPPYIDIESADVDASVKKFEPPEALFSEDKGFYSIQSWSQLAYSLLKNGGLVGFEIGYDQGPRALEHFQRLGFLEVTCEKDYSGRDRHVFAKK